MKNIPSMTALIAAAQAAGVQEEYRLSSQRLTDYLRDTVNSCRAAVLTGQRVDLSPAALITDVRRRIQRRQESRLRRVINATGILLHTNLGRAPLGLLARQRVQAVAAGYCNLEYDTDTGGRGSRMSHIGERLARLVGAEAALAVNNNAAAVLLVLAALAAPGEVIVSRGEQVEIGGMFRIPDVIRQSGAQLVEVGTTNRTHLADYRDAITANTTAILKVHTSNYRISGFTKQPTRTELAELAKEKNIPLFEDVGSGLVLPVAAVGGTEPTVAEILAAGVDLVLFSGDKLLGGPQAGIIVGTGHHIQRLAKHPLMRALRLDKLSVAALEGTLLSYERGSAPQDVPILHFLGRGEGELRQMAEELACAMRQELPEDLWCTVLSLQGEVGGGALPEARLESWGVSVDLPGGSPEHLVRYLRRRSVPIVARCKEGKVLFDMRTLFPGEAAEIGAALRDYCQGGMAE